MARIEATGSYLPRKVLTNDGFKEGSLFLPIRDFFTGFHERRHAGPDETGIVMAVNAARALFVQSKYKSEDIDLVVGSIIPNENLYGEDLNLVACELGLKNASVLPINTTCSTFISSLNLANAYIGQGLKKVVLILISVNWTTTSLRTTEKDFAFAGDGAAAVILDDDGASFIDVEERNQINLGVFYSMYMRSPVFTNKKEYFEIKEFKGVDIVKDLIHLPVEVLRKLLLRHPLLTVDKVFLHQSGTRMMHYWLDNVGISRDKLRHTIDKYANMTAANIPVSLDYWNQQGDLQRGDMLLFFSPAAGGHSIAMLWKY